MSKLGTLACAAALSIWTVAAAADVDVELVSVTPGQSAEIAISGGSPIRIDIGQTIEGVTLISADRRGAVVRVRGVTKTLSLAARRGPTGGGGGGDSVTLVADASGHFMANGAVNGRPVRFIVDTGATYMAIDRASAERIGLDYERGTATRSMTVNGVVRGWLVKLDSVQVGNAMERNVDAVVIDNDSLPYGLLGMSYLNRFDMQRNGATLVLRRRR